MLNNDRINIELKAIERATYEDSRGDGFRSDKSAVLSREMRDLYEIQAERQSEIIVQLEQARKSLCEFYADRDQRRQNTIDKLSLGLFGLVMFVAYLVIRR